MDREDDGEDLVAAKEQGVCNSSLFPRSACGTSCGRCVCMCNLSASVCQPGTLCTSWKYSDLSCCLYTYHLLDCCVFKQKQVICAITDLSIKFH